MIKAILLDLDNTLIINPDETFAKNYIALAEPFFSEKLGIVSVREMLVGIVKALSTPRLGDLSNIQLIYSHFQQHTTAPIETIRQTLDAFFEQEYPKLAKTIGQIPIAKDIVTFFQQQGYAVVLATNPIYAKTAIMQRMTWGNLPLNDYALITHAENMHFAKPDPAYYAEIVARVGVEPDEAIIIGDNLINDIGAGNAMGLNTLTILDTHSLEQVLKQFQDPNYVHAFVPPILSFNMVLHELRGNIGALVGLLEGVTEDMWLLHPVPNEWSILQILCHLLASETTTQRIRLEHILTQDNPFIIDPKPPGPNLPICSEDLPAITQQFIQERQTTIALLRACKDEDWQRPARHSVFGLTTLLEMAHFTAQHDRIHINQLCQTIGRCKEYSF